MLEARSASEGGSPQTQPSLASAPSLTLQASRAHSAPRCEGPRVIRPRAGHATGGEDGPPFCRCWGVGSGENFPLPAPIDRLTRIGYKRTLSVEVCRRVSSQSHPPPERSRSPIPRPTGRGVARADCAPRRPPAPRARQAPLQRLRGRGPALASRGIPPGNPGGMARRWRGKRRGHPGPDRREPGVSRGRSAGGAGSSAGVLSAGGAQPGNGIRHDDRRPRSRPGR